MNSPEAFYSPDFIYKSKEELISHQINHQFYLPTSITATLLSNYFILHWQGYHLAEQITQSPTVYEKETITRDGISYLISFDSSLTAWKFSQNLQAQYKLSFRKTKDAEFGTVLIRSLTN